MRKSFVFFVLILNLNFFGQNVDQPKDWIVLLNGDSLRTEIIQLKTNSLKVKMTDGSKKKIKAEEIKSFYYSFYNAKFISYKVGKKMEHEFLGKFLEGEITIYSTLKELYSKDSNGGNINSGLFVLDGTPYFKYLKDKKDTLYLINSESLLKFKDYNCNDLMVKLIKGLSEYELSKYNRVLTYKELVIKYNNQCEALKREEEDEKNNNKR